MDNNKSAPNPDGLPANSSTNPPANPPLKDINAYQAVIEIQQQQENLKQKKSYIKAYTLSILLPPIGIYYLIKYLFFSNGLSEDIRAGIISFILTIISLFLNIWLFGAALHQFGSVSSNSSSVLQELITPSNQKDMMKLLQ